MENSPALAGNGFCGADGLVMSLMRLAHARPKTTMSSRLLGQGRRLRVRTDHARAQPEYGAV